MELWSTKGYINLDSPADPRQGFDHEADPVFQNLGSDLGLLKAMGLLMHLGPLGLWYGGLPCDSFGFLSSPTHGRGALTPWGNPWPFVFSGNVLCTRYAMLALIAIIRGCVWALEQPEKQLSCTCPHSLCWCGNIFDLLWRSGSVLKWLVSMMYFIFEITIWFWISDT